MATSKSKKVFSAESKNKKKVEDLEPIVFDFYGEELTALAWVPGLVTLQYLEGIADDENNGAQLKAIRYMLKNSFDAKNLAKFDRIANNPENGIEIDELMDLLGYLSEERSNRSLKDSSQ